MSDHPERATEDRALEAAATEIQRHEAPWTVEAHAEIVAIMRRHGLRGPERPTQPFNPPPPPAAGTNPEHPGQGAAYFAWIGQRWQEWEAETRHTGPKRTEDHEAFDAWLVRLTSGPSQGAAA